MSAGWTPRSAHSSSATAPSREIKRTAASIQAGFWNWPTASWPAIYSLRKCRHLRYHHVQQRPQHIRQRHRSNPAGDRENIAASAIFAAIDPATGGGLLNANGVVPLRNSLDNPALSGGDPLAAGLTDQLGTARPLPAGSLPDIGAVELSHSLSTTPQPTTTCSAAPAVPTRSPAAPATTGSMARRQRHAQRRRR